VAGRLESLSLSLASPSPGEPPHSGSEAAARWSAASSAPARKAAARQVRARRLGWVTRVDDVEFDAPVLRGPRQGASHARAETRAVRQAGLGRAANARRALAPDRGLW